MSALRPTSPFLTPAMLLLGLATSPAGAAVLEVPSAYPTITSAIAAAAPGDTVRVAPGTYLENIDFAGKDIIVTSHYTEDGDWGVVESTVVDGSSAAGSDSASTVTFRSGEGPGAVLQGFTVTGGTGTVWVDPQFPSYTWRGGGGIFCFQSSPTIRFTVIAGNRVDNGGDVDGAQGGGVLLYGGDPVLHNSLITDNRAEYGGGLVVDYSGATVRNTVIARNTGGDSYGGGGVWTIGSGNAPIVFENCAIMDNISPTRGGAMYIWSSTVSIRSSILWGNQQAVGAPIATVSGGEAAISFCDVEGGSEGEGNVDIDPSFADRGRSLLSPSSPCVDAGDPAASARDPEDPGSPGSAAWPALGGLRNDMGAYGGPGSRAMGADEPSRTFYLVPAAAATAGAMGSFFVTDLDIHNGGDRAMRFHFLWLPRGEDNSAPLPSPELTLQPGATARYADVLGELFGIDDGVGAIAVDADGDRALIMSRTYNRTDHGTFGQAIPGLHSSRLTPAGDRVRLLFLTETADYRSNIGIVNGIDRSIVVSWELFGRDGATVGAGSRELPPWGSLQLNRPLAALAPIEAASVEVWSQTEGAAFTCYGSVLDNLTNDPTTILPVPDPSR